MFFSGRRVLCQDMMMEGLRPCRSDTSDNALTHQKKGLCCCVRVVLLTTQRTATVLTSVLEGESPGCTLIGPKSLSCTHLSTVNRLARKI